MKTAGKMFCFVVLLVFCGMGQISIGYEDVMGWGDRRGLNFYYSIENLTLQYPQLNMEIPVGENVTWDFSQYPVYNVDTTIYYSFDKEEPSFLNVFTSKYKIKLSSELDSNYLVINEDTAYIDALISLEVDKSLEENDFSFFGPFKINQQYMACVKSGLSVVYDTLFEFDLNYGDNKLQIADNIRSIYCEEPYFCCRDSIVRIVNGYGTVILPGGEEVDALGLKELHFMQLYFNEYQKVFNLLRINYSLYCKQYGLLFLVEHSFYNPEGSYPSSYSSLYDSGNTYNMSEIERRELSNSGSAIWLFHSNLNSEGSINHNIPSKTYALPEITDKTYYDLMGRKISENKRIDNGYSGVVILKGGRKGRVLKKLMVGENR